MLDHRSGILGPRQRSAQLAVDNPSFAQSRKGLMRWRQVNFGRIRQLCKLHTGHSEVGNEVLHPAQRALNGLNAVVCIDVIDRVERLLELPQIEVATECRHRVLQGGVLTREILEMTSDVTPPAVTVNLAGLGGHGDRSGRQHVVDPRKGPIHAASVVLATATAQSVLASTQPRPQILAIDQYAAVGHDLRQERRLGLSVFELNDVNRTTHEPSQLRDEVDNTLEACIAQIDKHIDIAPRLIRSGSR
jgi:hypothetical protein